MAGFVSVCVALGAEQGGVDDGWSRFSLLFDIHSEYCGQPLDKPFPIMRDKEGGYCAPEAEYIRSPTHFLAFPLCQRLQDPPSCYRPLNNMKDARPSCARYPSTFVFHQKGI